MSADVGFHSSIRERQPESSRSAALYSAAKEEVHSVGAILQPTPMLLHYLYIQQYCSHKIKAILAAAI